MSSEEFEKLHEMYISLYDEVKLMPERAQRCQGGKQTLYIYNSTMTAGFDVSDVYIVRLVDSESIHFRPLSAYKSVGQKHGLIYFIKHNFFLFKLFNQK